MRLSEVAAREEFSPFRAPFLLFFPFLFLTRFLPEGPGLRNALETKRCKEEKPRPGFLPRVRMKHAENGLQALLICPWDRAVGIRDRFVNMVAKNSVKRDAPIRVPVIRPGDLLTCVYPVGWVFIKVLRIRPAEVNSNTHRNQIGE